MKVRTAAVVLACSVLGSFPALAAPAAADPPTSSVCGPVSSGWARCLSVRLDDPSDWRGRHAAGATNSPLAPANGYGPSDLRSAYNLPSASQGHGQLVAIVDAFDDPNAESDLAAYRSAYGLPPCTTANGCFRKVDEAGGTNYPHGNFSWAFEISIDLDMVSAVCPNCHLVLVEGTTSSIADLGTAESTAAGLGANAISNSYGANENQKDPTYDAQYYDHPGISVVAATGDHGYGTFYPGTSPVVTAVGGTSLLVASNARGWSETAWSGSSSGCSTYGQKPVWQIDPGCPTRAVADVAAVADPTTGVAVYDTYKSSGWLVAGGTSVASPIIASVYALAGNESSLTEASRTYANTADLYDIVSGSTGNCGTYLCNAVPGYDGPTGNGTPNGTKAF